MTTETLPFSESIIGNLDVDLKPKWSWQHAVRDELIQISKHYKSFRMAGSNIVQVIDYENILRELDNLGSSYLPTINDIKCVVRVARNISRGQFRGNTIAHYRPVWRVYGSVDDDNKEILVLNSKSVTAKLSLLCDTIWADTLPKLSKYKIVPSEKVEGNSNHLPLYSVSSFKGLEADGIIFFIRSLQDQIMPTLLPDLYVGSSRARFYLHLVIHDEAFKYMPKQYLEYEYYV